MDEQNANYNTVNAGVGTVVTDTYEYINNILTNPTVFIILVVVLLVNIITFVSLGGQQPQTNAITNSSATSLSVIVVAIFIVLIIVNGLQYFIGIDIVARLKNIIYGIPEVDILIDTSRIDAAKAPVPEILLRKQVFNIPDNKFVYSDAKAICSAYGARLATYKEVEDNYEEGGEWCNYGWSEDQMALFPTQQKTWDELQKIQGHENDCGRPGVNGGYIANPLVKFGVNCFGYKPKMTQTEEDLMANDPIYPKTKKDIAMEKRVDYWKDKLTEVLVSPFNHNSWSRL